MRPQETSSEPTARARHGVNELLQNLGVALVGNPSMERLHLEHLFAVMRLLLSVCSTGRESLTSFGSEYLMLTTAPSGQSSASVGPTYGRSPNGSSRRLDYVAKNHATRFLCKRRNPDEQTHHQKSIEPRSDTSTSIRWIALETASFGAPTPEQGSHPRTRRAEAPENWNAFPPVCPRRGDRLLRRAAHLEPRKGVESHGTPNRRPRRMPIRHSATTL